MAGSIKWIVLGVLCAVITFFLYRFIDSDWSQDHGASIWITIGFFLAAMGTIMSAFSAIDETDHSTRH